MPDGPQPVSKQVSSISRARSIANVFFTTNSSLTKYTFCFEPAFQLGAVCSFLIFTLFSFSEIHICLPCLALLFYIDIILVVNIYLFYFLFFVVKFIFRFLSLFTNIFSNFHFLLAKARLKASLSHISFHKHSPNFPLPSSSQYRISTFSLFSQPPVVTK